MKCEISVILTIYNEPIEQVKECIESLLNQTLKSTQIIAMVDNPKNIEVIKILEEYKKIDNNISLYVNEINIGLPRTLNKAIKLCKGRYIARMDADDICLRKRFEVQWKFLNENKDVDLVGSRILKIDEDGNEIFESDNRVICHNDIIKFLYFGQPIAHPTWMGKSEVFKNIMYNDLHAVEDMDFLCRAVLRGYKLANIPTILLRYRVRSNSISNSSSLKQFICTQEIGKEFQAAFEKKKEYNYKKNCNFKLREQDEILYKKALDNYYKSSILLKENKKSIIYYFFNIILSLFISKYFRKKIFRNYKKKYVFLQQEFKY